MMIKNCVNCHCEYSIKPSHALKSKFCSRKCVAISNKGKKPWNTGLKGYTNGGTFKKGHKGVNIPPEDAHHMWRGEKVGYTALHHWVRKHLGSPPTCVLCWRTNLAGKSIGWANISGEYKRNLNDWMRLCKRCHSRYDRRSRAYSAKDLFRLQGRPIG